MLPAWQNPVIFTYKTQTMIVNYLWTLGAAEFNYISTTKISHKSAERSTYEIASCNNYAML
jgi:hypothetical protein